jgi:CRISPR-associated protein Cas2
MAIRHFSGDKIMLMLVSYDVMVSSSGGPKRLRKVAKACTNYGQRVQFSVFECVVDPAQWVALKNTLENIVDIETDSLRYYYLGANYKKRVEHFGLVKSYAVEEPLII